MSKVHRGTYAEVNLAAIKYNIIAIQEKLPKTTKIMAVVKADGYGHGAAEVAGAAIQAGAKMLAVAIFEEALHLRAAGITSPILVFGYVDPEDAVIAVEKNIILSCFQASWIDEVEQLNLPKPLQIHMVWDTGMGRLGIRSKEDLKILLDKLKQSKQLNLIGVYAHFATADEEDLTYFHKQQEKFQNLLTYFEENWDEKVAFHTGNSAASIRFLKERKNFIRFGVSLYGLYPSVTVKNEKHIKLKPAMSLYSRLVHVKQIQAGDSLSYGATYTAEQTEWIGTIPIGYADGWIRKLQGFKVLVNGKYVPIVGRICMDQMMVKLDQSYPVGTKVTLIGKDDSEQILMDDVAKYLETINYEIPCNLTQRVPRVYVGS